MKPERTSRTALFLVVLGLLSLPTLAPQAPGQPAKTRPAEKFRVVGYLPDYRVAAFDPDVAKYLTDLIYFAAEPGPTGETNLDRIKPATLKLLHQVKDKHGVRVHLCLGGGSRSKGFPALAASPAARKRLVEEVTQFCVKNSFDGVDVDWEHPSTPQERLGHALLLTEMKKSFQPQRLRLTVALAGWQEVLPAAIKAVDGVHLMSYDAKGRHSTYEFAQTNLARMAQKGIPPAKLYLGMPFYGRSIQAHDKAFTYAEIVKKYNPAPEVDEVDGIYFNGIKMIERKTRLALASRLGGVMVWELGQDTRDDRSLLRAIHRTVQASQVSR